MDRFRSLDVSHVEAIVEKRYRLVCLCGDMIAGYTPAEVLIEARTQGWKWDSKDRTPICHICLEKVAGEEGRILDENEGEEVPALKNWFETLLKECKNDFDFRLECLLLGLTEQIAKIMREKNITRADFAQRLNVSPAVATEILKGNSNFALRTLLAIADALERRLEINFVEGRQATTLVNKNEKGGKDEGDQAT